MLTCAQALDHYYKEHAAVKAVAVDRIQFAIDALNSILADTLLRDVDIPRCRKYAVLRGVSPGTARRELGTLQAAANHCLRWRHIKSDEMPSIELPASSQPKMLWLTKEEAGRLANSASGRALRFILLAYYTGARKRSIETLRWSQVDVASKRIDLSGPDGIRTAKRRPIVPIAPEILDRLKQWKVEAVTPWVLESPDDARYLFDTAARNCRLEFLPAIGLRPAGRLTPHVLRHSRATHLLQDGKSPYAVAGLLGDSVTTVVRVYGHHCADYLEAAIS